MNQIILAKQEIQFSEKAFKDFLKNEGLIVNTNTKARGNLGFYIKNRIDVSKDAPANRKMSILAHEYAHKINYDLDKEDFNKGSSLEKIFVMEKTDQLRKELVSITNFVDNNSTLAEFTAQKLELKSLMKKLEDVIKLEYPDFKRSYIFKPINNYFKTHKSSAKYLMKYDNIKINNSFLFLKKEESYSINDIDKDFPNIPESFRIYIKLKSIERKYKRISRYINKATKYYNKPTELFARFVQGLFIDNAYINKIAPITYKQFFNLLNDGHYGRLKDLLFLANLN